MDITGRRIKLLVDYYFKLINYCNNKEKFDEVTFRGMHDFYANTFKKMTIEMQGEVVEKITQRMKING